MEQDKGKLLQEEFTNLSNNYNIKCSFGYFVDQVNAKTYSYNMVTDNDLMNMIANLIIGIANRNEATPEQVIDALQRGISSMNESK